MVDPPYRRAEDRKFVEGDLVRLRWRDSSSGVQLAIIVLFDALLIYAAIAPWSDKLAFPFYRGVISLAGLGLAWFILCTLFNSTTVSIEGRTLQVRHGPVPTFGLGDRAFDVPLQRIVGVEHGVLSGVRLRLRDGTETKILNPPSDEQASIAEAVAKGLGVESSAPPSR
jgi:hypothetical protein